MQLGGGVLDEGTHGVWEARGGRVQPVPAGRCAEADGRNWAGGSGRVSGGFRSRTRCFGFFFKEPGRADVQGQACEEECGVSVGGGP